jgi:hypothetical protein
MSAAKRIDPSTSPAVRGTVRGSAPRADKTGATGLPVGLHTIVSAVLEQTAKQQQPLFTIQRRWGQLVGKALAAHTKPVSLRRGRLVVYVEQPGDGYALSFQRTALLKRLQTTTKGRVEELVIRPGDLSRAHGVRD